MDRPKSPLTATVAGIGGLLMDLSCSRTEILPTEIQVLYAALHTTPRRLRDSQLNKLTDAVHTFDNFRDFASTVYTGIYCSYYYAEMVSQMELISGIVYNLTYLRNG